MSLMIENIFFHIKNLLKNKNFLFVIFTLAVFIYLHAAIIHSITVNTSPLETDQNAYMHHVRTVYQNNFWFLGDRGRMPLYNYFQVIFYHPELTDNQLFLQGKLLNIFLSIGLLGLLYWVFLKNLSKFSSVLLVLITGFTIFMSKAPYFQCEVLYFFLSFLSFILIAKLISEPNWKLGIAAGAITAAAYLTKASVLLMVYLFVGFSIVQLVLLLLNKKNSPDPAQNKTRMKKIFYNMLAVFVGFLFFASPYLAENKLVYGKVFYNVNTNFYMWYDSWKQVKEGTRKHGDRVGWPDMPKEEIPSLGKYVKEHSLRQMVVRWYWGFKEITHFSFDRDRFSSKVTKYILIYFAFLLFTAIKNRAAFWEFIKKYAFTLLLAVTFLGLSYSAYSWAAVVIQGPRFIQPFYLPVLFGLFWMLTQLPANYFQINSIKFKYLNVLHVIVFILLIFDTYDLIHNFMFCKYLGL